MANLFKSQIEMELVVERESHSKAQKKDNSSRAAVAALDIRSKLCR